MRIAVFSDIHGNLPAFEQMLKDWKSNAVDASVFLGDIAFLGLYPQECAELLEQVNPMYCIKGNTDANVEDLDEFTPSNDFEKRLLDMCLYMDARMTVRSKSLLKSWHISEKTVLDQNTLVFCHGSPASYHHRLTEDNASQYAPVVIAEQADVLFCGHTHKTVNFTIGNTVIRNFGALGFSLNGDRRAHYGIVQIDGPGNISYEQNIIDYDIDGYMAEVKNQSPPFADMLLYSLKTGYALPHEAP